MSINAWDTKVSMLSSLLLANIRILSCFFFLILLILRNFLIIPVIREKIKLKLALAIPTLADEMIQTPLFFNCDSLHARLNSHYEAWSYKKKKHKKITAYRKCLERTYS